MGADLKEDPTFFDRADSFIRLANNLSFHTDVPRPASPAVAAGCAQRSLPTSLASIGPFACAQPTTTSLI